MLLDTIFAMHPFVLDLSYTRNTLAYCSYWVLPLECQVDESGKDYGNLTFQISALQGLVFQSTPVIMVPVR